MNEIGNEVLYLKELQFSLERREVKDFFGKMI